ncbi:MAG TPA: NAD(P)H-binding protein [Solirubrobacterales bacterium]|nr:NAD(P)H-binding protein [Solirubrobacterales bacterium]
MTAAGASAGGQPPAYLVAGATGVIGRRLVAALLADGVRVRALVRDAERGRRILGPEVELFEADLDRAPDLGAAMDGVGVAYFLVHMLGAGGDYSRREAAAAEAFAKAAGAADVERVVYLGGLGPDEGGSPHLDSRHHTAEALRRCGPPLTYFRAAMIIGPGSESYELLRSISARLPAVPEPDWLRSRTQPIGIRDVVAYLRAAPRIAAAAGREIQIGGPDVMRHLDVIARFSEETGRRAPLRVPLPGWIATPAAVAAGAGAVTAGTPEVATELGLGLADDTAVRDPAGAALFDISPEPLNVAIQRALAEQERGDG